MESKNQAIWPLILVKDSMGRKKQSVGRIKADKSSGGASK